MYWQIFIFNRMETPNTLKSEDVFATPDHSSMHSHVSPCGSNTQPMSASLKERLKKTRRSFNSPFSVAKRLKVDSDEEVLTTSDKAESVTECTKTSDPQSRPERFDMNRNKLTCETLSENGSEGNPNVLNVLATARPVDPSQPDLLYLREQLKKELREKTETLRRLKMAKMYRTKNDLTKLQLLIDKWRRCSQEVLFDLQSVLLVDGRKASISQLIDRFGLDDHLLHFDRTEDDFRHT
ncbi:hypothetical protein JZ751_027300 [Albula glossodonta]|uniref:Swi5-dependent recombination DNA repair protein 1 homolog n=1 Tax=Albula glossodonta TaxID=121402 RepID=A0A8T2NBW4_9TELE|nr:hypothetical protein JZ751_027300 [Albula glossodonta]